MVSVGSGSGEQRGPAASLIEISRVLEETARLVRQHARADIHVPSESATELSQVRAIIAARRLRRQYLGKDVNDATWAMMLELFAARLEGRRVHQTMLCVAAAVPQSTALRVTGKMLEAGIFLASSDPDDNRLLILGLSDGAAERIGSYLLATQGIIDTA